MSNDSDFSKILWQAYDQFMLPLGGKRVPTPYRRNEIGSYQKIGPEFQGKSSPQTLVRTTERLAKEQGFNLDDVSVEEIQEFMEKNKLGIDCSGFVYRMLDFLTKRLGLGSLEKAAGFEHVGRTNMAKFTSDEFSIPIRDLSVCQAGDIIRLNSGGDILHGVLILEHKNATIAYAHSSGITSPSGVHTGEIINNLLPSDLRGYSFNQEGRDGLRRLKIFQWQEN